MKGQSLSTIVILMIETEQPEGLSARKLVVESAKHNVLTAYTSAAGLELLRRFPAVTAAMVHAMLPDCQGVIHEILSIVPDLPIIVASPSGDGLFDGAKYVVPSHKPAALLRLLASEFGASTEN